MNFAAQYDSLHEMASAAMGLTDFGHPAYQTRLRQLLADLDNHMQLTDVGHHAVLQQITGLLIGRLRATQGLKENPEVLCHSIERPIFIIGLGRTGTTVLHRYIAEDPHTQSLPLWLASIPMPRPPRDQWESNPYFQQIKQGIDESPFFNEDMRKIHPVFADIPDECRWLLDQSFWATTFPMTYGLPDYFRALLNEPAVDAYQYYANALRLIANSDQRRWVLKDPSHMLGIDSLLKVFPDACIVQTHREPVESFRSLVSLGSRIRKMLEPVLDAKKVTDWTVYSWAEKLKKFERVRRDQNQQQFFDLHIGELKTDPVDAMERMYIHFGITITEDTRSAWLDIGKSDRGTAHAAHDPSDYGLTVEQVNEAVGDYYERYQTVLANVSK